MALDYRDPRTKFGIPAALDCIMENTTISLGLTMNFRLRGKVLTYLKLILSFSWLLALRKCAINEKSEDL